MEVERWIYGSPEELKATRFLQSPGLDVDFQVQKINGSDLIRKIDQQLMLVVKFHWKFQVLVL